MEQGTVALIQQLAAKLGTTSEYLWGVLIHQAPIAAATDVLQYIALGFAVWFYIKFVKSKGESIEGLAIVPAILFGVILTILCVVAFFAVPSTITAVVNPEYWALDKVLNLVKAK